MASWLDELPGRIGTAVSPYGFAPPQPGMVQGNPAAGAGMQFLGDMGMQMLANGRENPAVALGQAYGKARESARDRSKDAAVMKSMLEQAEQEKQKRHQERERKLQMEQAISQLPPEQQAMARMFPEKFFGEQIEQQFAPPQTPEGFTLGEGQVRYGPDGQQIAAGPPKQSDAETNKPPNGYRWTQNGLEPIPGGPADPRRELPPRSLRPTTDQTNAATFYDRMKAADAVISDPAVTASGLDYWGATKAGMPLGIGNYLATPEFRRYDQAKRDFINAVLRKESGAAIGESEFENAEKQYFPMPGDDEATLKQKAQNRRVAVDGMRRAGAPVLDMETPANDPASSQPPDGIDPTEWNAMTEEERALWEN